MGHILFLFFNTTCFAVYLHRVSSDICFLYYNQLEEFHIPILEGQSQQKVKVNNEIMNAARRLGPHLERLDMWFLKTFDLNR